MDLNQPNNGGGPQGVSAGKKKQKKNQNLSGGQINDKIVEQPKIIQGQQKTLQEQPKLDNQQIPNKSKETNPAKASEDGQKSKDNKQKQQQSQKQANPAKGSEDGQKSKDNKQKQQQSQKQANPAKDSENGQKSKDNKQKQQQSQKQANPEKSFEDGQKSKGENAADKSPSKFQVSSSTCNQQIEQQIAILKNLLSIPKRRNPKCGGTKGRATEVDVNHLPLNIDKLFKKTVYHIDVQFNPELPKRLLRTALEEFNRQNYPNVHFAFDGRRNMYTTKDLKGKTGMVSILNEENNKTIDFTIATSNVNTIFMSKIEDYLKHGSSNTTPGEAFQALDIILKNRPFSLRFTNVGRSFFPVPRITPVDLGEGMELWKGFFQSPVMGWKPYLNIDVSNKGFPKHQPLTEYISKELRADLTKEMDYKTFNDLSFYVKGLKVDFLIPNQPNTKRSYKVVGLLDTAAKFTFEMDDANSKKNITVAQYYKIARNYTIRYQNLPCLHVGNIAKKTAIPIELCVVQKGQLKMTKLTENQTATMVKNAARPPAERRQTIENCIKDIKYNQDAVLKEFGVEVQEKFASIPARVLAQPTLLYDSRETTPKAGVWRPDRFSKAVQLRRWVVLNLDTRTNMTCIKDFEKMLMESGRDLNVVIQPMIPVITGTIPRNTRSGEVPKWVADNYFGKLKSFVDLIVVIIPDSPGGVYAAVKQASELQVGILTQCIKAKTMYKMNRATASNILLKINSKLNGINHTLAIRSSPPSMDGAIIFGADVTHPSPDQTSIPSVAAVAASHDLRGSQYNMEWRLQSPKVEIIQDLEDIVHKQLLKFRERTKTIPKKIFYFRDGVSEGQFLQLLEHELIAIRRACLRLNIGYKPSVTFLVVQKRHHTRMFPKSSMDMDGKFGNVPSGTIIDTQITHPTELDFYLCSHASIQGTSRPTKYHLIWDDNNFTEDQLEELTFYLCFMFVRCTRSVSYPAPTYYAHLAAFRARAYIENKVINLNRLDEEQTKNKLEDSFTVDTPMFFV